MENWALGDSKEFTISATYADGTPITHVNVSELVCFLLVDGVVVKKWKKTVQPAGYTAPIALADEGKYSFVVKGSESKVLTPGTVRIEARITTPSTNLPVEGLKKQIFDKVFKLVDSKLKDE